LAAARVLEPLEVASPKEGSNQAKTVHMRGRAGLIVFIGVALVSGTLGAEIGYSVAGASTSSKRPSPTLKLEFDAL
jgi:hypothetical protein